MRIMHSATILMRKNETFVLKLLKSAIEALVHCPTELIEYRGGFVQNNLDTLF